MDLGGASTQLTFEAASPAEDPANEVQLRLYGQQYRVYTHSFLCYGRDQVLQRLLASALQVATPRPQPLCPARGREGREGTGPRAQGRARQPPLYLGATAGSDPAWAKAQWPGEVQAREAGQGQTSEGLECLARGLVFAQRQWGALDCS